MRRNKPYAFTSRGDWRCQPHWEQETTLYVAELFGADWRKTVAFMAEGANAT